MKKPNPPSIVTISIFTTITIVFWIFFSVYQILTSEPDPNVPTDLLLPINPNFNQDALESIQNGIYFNESDVTEFNADIPNIQPVVQVEEEQQPVEQAPEETPTPTPELEEITIATESALPTLSP